jgi:hypothetical protein
MEKEALREFLLKVQEQNCLLTSAFQHCSDGL